jgi:hypothetical protein
MLDFLLITTSFEQPTSPHNLPLIGLLALEHSWYPPPHLLSPHLTPGLRHNLPTSVSTAIHSSGHPRLCVARPRVLMHARAQNFALKIRKFWD